jgi:hypothetical protein
LEIKVAEVKRYRIVRRLPPGQGERLVDADRVAGPEWRMAGLCAQADPDAFFPEDEQWSGEAKRVCARCPVAATCLAYALAADERWGIWGGLTTKERDEVAAVLRGGTERVA